MNENFNKAFDKLLEVEGGYVNSKYDRGGKTKYGITEEVAKHYGYTGSMEELPLSEAKVIYYTQYWNKLKLDEIPDFAIAYELFDTGVNMGIYKAGSILQIALNLMNRCQNRYPDITADGIIGAGTIETFKKIPKEEYSVLFKILNGLQFYEYIKIVTGHPEQEMNFVGWMKRI